MRTEQFFACFIVIAVASQTASAGPVFMVDMFIEDINKDGSPEVSTAEVKAFYDHHWGPVVTRCNFVESMLHRFSNDAVLISVMFDVIKANNGNTLGEGELKKALLRSSDSVPVATLKSRLQALVAQVQEIMKSPSLNVEGPGLYATEDFKVDRLTDVIDANKNGQITRAEVSQSLPGLLDKNGDHFITRCEFVDAMRDYTQHPATSARLYDVIFKGRDQTWADVDSLFLLEMVNADGNSVTTVEEFKRFFTYHNFVESGLQASRDGTLISDNGGNGLIHGSSVVSLLVQTLAAFSLVVKLLVR